MCSLLEFPIFLSAKLTRQLQKKTRQCGSHDHPFLCHDCIRSSNLDKVISQVSFVAKPDIRLELFYLYTGVIFNSFNRSLFIN